MLIESVDDLDDWNSLAAAASPGPKGGGDAVEFRKKVLQMAEQKGDKGLLPFLDSLGLSLASASRLARYLSTSKSNMLPSLIDKVFDSILLHLFYLQEKKMQGAKFSNS